LCDDALNDVLSDDDASNDACDVSLYGDDVSLYDEDASWCGDDALSLLDGLSCFLPLHRDAS